MPIWRRVVEYLTKVLHNRTARTLTKVLHNRTARASQNSHLHKDIGVVALDEMDQGGNLQRVRDGERPEMIDAETLFCSSAISSRSGGLERGEEGRRDEKEWNWFVVMILRAIATSAPRPPP
jgi:hypothetical protein